MNAASSPSCKVKSGPTYEWFTATRPGAVRNAGSLTASNSTRSLTRAPAGKGASSRAVPAASRYEANRRTCTQICVPASATSVSIDALSRHAAPNHPHRGAIATHETRETRETRERDDCEELAGVHDCQRIANDGVLSLNGHDDPEYRVLRAIEMPVAGTATSLRFDILFTRFYSELFGLVYRVLGDRMETEDTLQEAFLKLFDAADLQARPDAEVGAWLRRVGLNLAFNRLRSAKRTRARLERVGRLERSDEEPLENELTGPSGSVVRQEERAAVRRALAEVPERQRECLLLRHSGYSYAEIAATLDLAIGSVGVLLARAEHAFRATYRRQTHP
jgi:RNA polymerase sigma factor (sigma-70 family)